jgi:hypothetical protein
MEKNFFWNPDIKLSDLIPPDQQRFSTLNNPEVIVENKKSRRVKNPIAADELKIRAAEHLAKLNSRLSDHEDSINLSFLPTSARSEEGSSVGSESEDQCTTHTG